MNNQNIKLGFTKYMTLLVIIFLIGVVIAQPGLPHQFFGNVRCQDSNNVPDNTIINVKINSEVIKSTKTINGRYGYDTVFMIWGLEDNAKLDFYVNNQLVSSINFIAGETTSLDLITSYDICYSTGSNIGIGSGDSSGGGEGSKSLIKDESSNKPDLNDIISGNIFDDEIINVDENQSIKNSPTIQSGEKYKNISQYFPGFKFNNKISLNISLISLIILLLVLIYSSLKTRKSKNL